MYFENFQKYFDEKQIQFDVEFGNIFESFSGSRMYPDLYNCESKLIQRMATTRANIESAEIVLTDEIKISEKALIHRDVKFEIANDSLLYDMVSRFVVIDSSMKRPAFINNVAVNHNSSNIYYQFPNATVIVPIGNEKWIKFNGSQQGVWENNFEHVFYLRDEAISRDGNRWIVHQRIIATENANTLAIRICHPLYNKPIPKRLNSILPEYIKMKLFRIREKRYPNFPIMTIGQNKVEKGRIILLRSNVELVSKI